MGEEPPIASHCLSDTGRVRASNEDAWSADPATGLFLVADGMGAMSSGEVAAKATAEVLPKIVQEKLAALPKRTGKAVKDALKESIAQFSAELRERSKQDSRLVGMGAAMVLAFIKGRRVYAANLGDSRAYLLEKGRLRRLSKDHTITAVLLAHKKITPEQAQAHPGRHRLSRYVGMDGHAIADVQTVRVKVPGRLLLCTDGLWGMLPDERIQAVLAEEPSPEAACQRLVAEANEAGGEDNITAMAVELKGKA
ncbi:MAG: serine/threonine-protein phosphatase [Elusimicrobia bacterium]|nr:serine/threonine-protein phosphatase [Elusimicrobiota bacterium]